MLLLNLKLVIFLEIPLLLSFGEYSSNLFVSGQVKRIVSWNLVREKRNPDIQTQTDLPLTSMTVFDK